MKGHELLITGIYTQTGKDKKLPPVFLFLSIIRTSCILNLNVMEQSKIGQSSFSWKLKNTTGL